MKLIGNAQLDDKTLTEVSTYQSQSTYLYTHVYGSIIPNLGGLQAGATTKNTAFNILELIFQ